ncbi:DUF3501 family protein [Candidatus Nitronereus thalassa]|uniref:DUF3501 family protein n=1 Tax=Candidatus Nitronereus thalassa TaxID=3020898 RepID=A0ABU3K701_9BACT|nr:DUF3501 family protein [Candidatus Nitronereus thalassa]MDT7042156.1 DUF3501 family protein [Candidatus Nitronereus thalassa]
MKPLTQSDLLSHADYEAQRPTYRQQIIALKKRRRIEVGPLVTLLFENRETLKSQIQEMVRAERIFEESKIQDELDVYNAILPQPGELSATLMIEITEDDRIKTVLDSFQGFDRSESLSIRVDNEAVYAQFEAGHSKEDKISAVHFIRFSVPPAFTQLLQNPRANVSIQVAHEHYVAEAKVPEEMKDEWLKDLAS